MMFYCLNIICEEKPIDECLFKNNQCAFSCSTSSGKTGLGSKPSLSQDSRVVCRCWAFILLVCGCSARVKVWCYAKQTCMHIICTAASSPMTEQVCKDLLNIRRRAKRRKTFFIPKYVHSLVQIMFILNYPRTGFKVSHRHGAENRFLRPSAALADPLI